MAEAIVGGIIEGGIARAQDLRIGEPVEIRRAQLAERFSIECYPNNLEAVDGADLVILAIKPQDLAAACADLAITPETAQTVISIVAGVKGGYICDRLGKDNPVVRCMPNIAATVDAAATSYLDEGLRLNRTWYYRVRAVTASGPSAWSNIAIQRTKEVVHATGTLITPTSISRTWSQELTEVGSLEIQRKKGSKGTWVEIATPDASVGGRDPVERRPNGTAADRPR